MAHVDIYQLGANSLTYAYVNSEYVRVCISIFLLSSYQYLVVQVSIDDVS
jgi:hypothetical protein